MNNITRLFKHRGPVIKNKDQGAPFCYDTQGFVGGIEN
jgi:hypothetical protein